MSLDSVTVSSESWRPEKARWPLQHAGISALLLAIGAVVLEVLAIGIGSAGGSAGSAWITATVIAWFVIGVQAISFTLGLAAIFRGRGQDRVSAESGGSAESDGSAGSAGSAESAESAESDAEVLTSIRGRNGRQTRNHGRRLGLAAVVVSILTNPLLLIALFSLLRGTS